MWSNKKNKNKELNEWNYVLRLSNYLLIENFVMKDFSSFDRLFSHLISAGKSLSNFVLLKINVDEFELADFRYVLSFSLAALLQ